jgi:hypothetical protein
LDNPLDFPESNIAQEVSLDLALTHILDLWKIAIIL